MQVSFTDKKLIHLFDLCAEYNAANVAHRYYLKFNGCKVSTKMCKIIEGICYSHFVNGVRRSSVIAPLQTPLLKSGVHIHWILL